MKQKEETPDWGLSNAPKRKRVLEPPDQSHLINVGGDDVNQKASQMVWGLSNVLKRKSVLEQPSRPYLINVGGDDVNQKVSETVPPANSSNPYHEPVLASVDGGRVQRIPYDSVPCNVVGKSWVVVLKGWEVGIIPS